MSWHEQLIPFLKSRRGQYLAYGLSGLLGVVVLLEVWESVKFFIQPASPIKTVSVQPVSAPTNLPAVSTPDLGQLHIFGEYQIESEAGVANEMNALNEAPVTSLNLKLTGVFVSSDEADASAVISSGSQGERLYAVGAKLPGGVKIYKILADRVILEHNGSFEVLLLPKHELPEAAFTGVDTSINKFRRIEE